MSSLKRSDIYKKVAIIHLFLYNNRGRSLKENEAIIMATSSITHNFVVSNPKSVKRFVTALEEAEHDRTPKQTLPGRQLTDPKEILALMAKRKK